MTPQITLKTIADKIGLSESTISRVLNGKGEQYRISSKTIDLIQKTAAELQFTPNPLAQGLRTNKTHTIGLIIPDISNIFFANIARHIEREARKHSYSIILCDSEEDSKLENESIELLKRRKVDGFIISPVGIESLRIKELYHSGIPVVIIDRYFQDEDIPFVASDNYKGAFDAVDYLIKSGHTKIACIQGLRKTAPNNERVRGYMDAHKIHNIPVNKHLLVGDSFGEQNGFLETKLLLNKFKITAIFALSNLISLGVIRAIKEEGLIIPDHISLISFDDQPYSEYLSTPMTTISQQHSEMGQIAVKLLINQMNSQSAGTGDSVLLATRLIIRNSVKVIN